jgi:hypothetical protein
MAKPYSRNLLCAPLFLRASWLAGPLVHVEEDQDALHRVHLCHRHC